jgi:hypothetical protein
MNTLFFFKFDFEKEEADRFRLEEYLLDLFALCRLNLNN